MANDLEVGRLRLACGAQVLSRARLPSRHGEFQIVAFVDDAGRSLDDVAIVRGEVRGRAEVPTRIHSECLTGDVFGSYRCDCRDQLGLALQRNARGEAGIVLYLRQEGRGIGIAQKIRAYHLQEQGLDTVEANLHLGFDDDLRDYAVAAAVLRALEVGSVVLHTNNLAKVAGLQVVCRVPLIAEAREQNRRYLATKRDKSGHLL